MDFSKKVKMALAYKGMSAASLARALGISPQSLSVKMKKNTFTQKDAERIAEALGCEWQPKFIFPDGTAI
jgi:transcriptional regulator with XRE-family HTH domain